MRKKQPVVKVEFVCKLLTLGLRDVAHSRFWNFHRASVQPSLRFATLDGQLSGMKPSLLWCLCFVFLCAQSAAAPKQHVVSFGKWTTVKWLVGEDENRTLDVKVRSLLVDGHTKEFTVGPVHDITDRIFAVQRMYRLNDSLAQESGSGRWRWERGGWLLVDRISGKVEVVPLPEFDPYLSSAAWFRDYTAYCGVSNDGKKIFAIVSQVGKRKPVLKKAIGDAGDDEMPDSACSAPVWQRAPTRVTFSPKGDQKFIYTIRSRALELVAQDEDGDDE